MRIKIYDDMKSIFHTLVGFVGVVSGFSVEATVLFAVYQLAELIDKKETHIDVLFDMVEYIVGIVIALLVRSLYSLVLFS